MRLPVLVFDFGNVVAYFDYRRFLRSPRREAWAFG